MKKILLALAAVVLMASYASASVSVGVDPVANANSLAIRYDFTKEIVGKLGINYNNLTIGGASTSTTGYGAQLGYLLPVNWGGAQPLVAVNYSNDGATTSTSIISLRLGVEVKVADGVKLSAGITPYASMSGAVSGSNLGTDSVWLAFYCKVM